MWSVNMNRAVESVRHTPPELFWFTEVTFARILNNCSRPNTVLRDERTHNTIGQASERRLKCVYNDLSLSIVESMSQNEHTSDDSSGSPWDIPGT